jgi:hypothetical protein
VAKKARTPKPPRAAGAGGRQVQAPQRRAGAARKPPAGSASVIRSRSFWPIVAGVVAVVIVGIGLGIGLTRSGSAQAAKFALAGPINWKSLPGLQTTKPPWPDNSTSLSLRLPSLGLNALSQEQLAFHIHQHLDLYVNGKHVNVPQEIGYGVDPTTGQPKFITELHTHNSLGIIHVESAQVLKYQLRQFFGEWGVRLTRACLGSFKGSCDHLQWYLNGVKQTGDPGRLVLKNHQEIVITVGTPPTSFPKSYDFAGHGV